MNAPIVMWKVIADFPDYEVSDEGQVRRVTSAMGTRAGLVLQPSVQDGYPRYSLLDRKKKLRSIRAHKLVADAFLPPRPSAAHEVAHWDGDRANPCESNLRWATQREQWDDRRRHGTDLRGEQLPQSKLTDKKVLWAIEQLEAGRV